MTSVLVHEALAPLRADPSTSAILLDIDGTLAPIVQRASDAKVPQNTRNVLMALARRYALVGCISGRQAADARTMVAISTIPYVGAHGGEILRPGWTAAVVDPRLAEWLPRIDAFKREFDTVDLKRHTVRVEDKGPLLAFHWRGAEDERAAREAVDMIAAQAGELGLDVHWGRKVMEIRPPVRVDKGDGVQALLKASSFGAVLYAGDDVTDLDAFHALRAMHNEGAVAQVVCVGVRSEDGPPEIVDEADIVVDGTAGVLALLNALIDD